MVYHYTDEELNYLNRDKNVYSVNDDFCRRNKTLKVTENPQNKAETNTVTAAGQDFQVVATKTDKETGFDGMAVAPIVNGKPDYKSIAIIAAGTDPNNKTEKPLVLPSGFPSVEALPTIDKQGKFSISSQYKLPHTDLSRDTASAIEGRLTSLSPQYKVLDQFVQDMMRDPRYDVVQLSGYSQGSFAIKVGAKYGIPTTTFNSWFQYQSLTKEELAFIKKHSLLFRDYRRQMDYTVFLNDFNHPEWFGAEKGLPIYWADNKRMSHAITDWEFDPKTGMVVDSKGRSLVSQSSFALIDTMREMAHYQAAKTARASGGFSRTEEIFLDSVQGSILSAHLSSAAGTGSEEIADLCKEANVAIEEIWSKIDFSSYTHLPYWEVESLFASYGVTRGAFVEDFVAESKAIETKAEGLAEHFSHLNRNIQQSIETMVEQDRKLAEDFSEWTRMK